MMTFAGGVPDRTGTIGMPGDGTWVGVQAGISM
jgi:hypothetical protein